MWSVIVILIFAAAIAPMGWLLLRYERDVGKAFGVFLSGCQSVLFAIGVILIEAVKAAIVAALIGGGVGLICFFAKVQEPTTKAVAISIAGLIFTLLVLKALWENFNNLRWSIRNEIRNRYRKR